MGVPGDEIELINNTVFLNGEALNYGPLSEGEIAGMSDSLQQMAVFAEENVDGARHAVMALPGVTTPLRTMQKVVVPEGQYFLMGDNRDNSRDSRSYGFADRNLFLGQARRVLVSFNIQDYLKPRLDRFGSALR